MQKTVFYSWQSDLPNNSNRSFIQKAIEKAIAQLQKDNLHLDLALDRDTKKTEGTPEIANTILSKIEKSKVFIADISIVYSDSKKRKCPNPNVLLELGYAAKAIGWSNIICIYNTQFGKIDDLPFDIRHRRIISYSTANQELRRANQETLTNTIRDQISLVVNKVEGLQTITHYIKSTIDKIILSLCNDLFKIVYQYEQQMDSQALWNFLFMKHEEITNLLKPNKFIGFSILKNWREYSDEFEKIINQPLFVEHSNQQLKERLIRVIESVKMFSYLIEEPDQIKTTSKKADSFEIVGGAGLDKEKSADRFILGKKIDKNNLVVVDSSNLTRATHSKALQILELTDKSQLKIANAVSSLILSIKNLVQTNGNSILIKP